LDCDFERHNIFLNNNKLTALLHSAAATSPDTAIAPATIALLSTDGPVRHSSQRSITPRFCLDHL